MSDEPDEVNPTDELLSALIDGELDPDAASQLRARLAREPALAARLADFERIDAAMRAIPAPEVPADLAARTRARIAAQPGTELSAATETVASRQRRSAPARRRRLWPVGAGLATAAALALYLMQPNTAPELPTRTATTAVLQSEIEPVMSPSVNPSKPAEPISLLASADDDELGIALYFDVLVDELADFELLEQLELLEALATIEEAETS